MFTLKKNYLLTTVLSIAIAIIAVSYSGSFQLNLLAGNPTKDQIGTSNNNKPISKAEQLCTLYGTITDSKGNPIAAASIMDSSGSWGATTDLDGYFAITNMKAGVYEIHISHTGYHNMVFREVKIGYPKTELDVVLFRSPISLEPVVVIVERPVIQLNCTASSRVSLGAIKPRSVAEVVKVTTGFKIDEEGTMHSRGGRAGDVAFIVEGVDRSDPLVDTHIGFSFGSESIDEVNVLTSGFKPRYGIQEREITLHKVPQVFNTEEYSYIQSNQFKLVANTPLSTFSIDVDAASYSNIRRYINRGQLPPKDAVRIEEMINYFSYDYPNPSGSDPFSITTELSNCPWNADNLLVHIGLQGKRIPLSELPPCNLVFLIDVSGSMNRPNKLPLLKASFRLLIDQLRPEDTISMVVYAGAAGVVLPPTSGNCKHEIYGALDRLEAGGSTAGGAGIKLAYKLAKKNFSKKGNNRVILATDGDFNIGISSSSEMVRLIEKKRKTGVFLTVLGFGTGNLKDSRMEQIADKGNGNYYYIDNINEAAKVLVNELGSTLLTLGRDVKIQVEFNPVHVKAYRLVGYENRLLAKEDFSDDRKDAGELGAGHSVTALYEIVPAGSSAQFPDVDELKYQDTELVKSGKFSNEFMTVKLRYKTLDDDKSILIPTEVLADDMVRNPSDNYRFSAAVAEFGMLLRDSEFKGDLSFEDVIDLAKSSKGKDDEGYRAEFIRLVQTCELLNK